MSKFTGPLAVRFEDDGWAVLVEPLVWECDFKGSGLVATVPAGFASNGVSMPRLLWWFLPPWGDRATRAAILHDYLCQRVDEARPVVGAETRAACDRQFRLALMALGIAPWRAWLCWAGVRAYSISHDLTGWPAEDRKGH